MVNLPEIILTCSTRPTAIAKTIATVATAAAAATKPYYHQRAAVSLFKTNIGFFVPPCGISEHTETKCLINGMSACTYPISTYLIEINKRLLPANIPKKGTFIM